MRGRGRRIVPHPIGLHGERESERAEREDCSVYIGMS